MARIEGNYLIVDEPIKEKKITGHSFVDILGFNPFTKIGDAILKFHKVIDEKIDEKWLKRGDFAEKIVQHIYTRDGHKITIYDKKEVKYDNFQDNQDFGGLIDIDLLDEKTLVEVKSKSLKDYEYICKLQPQNEIMQGMYYAKLRRYEKFTMEWIFFDPKTEEQIFNGKKPTTLANLKRLPKTYKVDDSYITAKMFQVLEIVKDFRKNRKIPLDLISDECLAKLGLKRETNLLESLPF